MNLINKRQLKKLHVLLSQLGWMEEKQRIVYRATIIYGSTSMNKKINAAKDSKATDRMVSSLLNELNIKTHKKAA